MLQLLVKCGKGRKGYKNVVTVTLGTGVGGGIIIDGNMISGTLAEKLNNTIKNFKL